MISWEEIEKRAAEINKIAKAAGVMIATAESCTGGLIAGALTEIAGSSAVVDRGFITYSNEAKHQMLGVQTATLETFGAVSEETALEMAAGAVQNSNAVISVAVTGIAGPGGGSATKPVGLVHLASCYESHSAVHRRMEYGDLGRQQIRYATIITAFEMLSEQLMRR